MEEISKSKKQMEEKLKGKQQTSIPVPKDIKVPRYAEVGEIPYLQTRKTPGLGSKSLGEHGTKIHKHITDPFTLSGDPYKEVTRTDLTKLVSIQVVNKIVKVTGQDMASREELQFRILYFLKMVKSRN